MRTSGLLLALFILPQCGPGKPQPGDTDTAVTETDSGVSTTTGTTGTTSTTGSSTSGPATTAGSGCAALDQGNVWVCDCTTLFGPWKPFNDACGRDQTIPVEWSEWLCETYAADDLFDTTATTGDEDPSDTTAGTDPTEPRTDPTTGPATTTGDGDDPPLGCKCTCEVTPECCDDSLP
ncbi:hypothetical protein [Nannocystis bainbridge]|uniref:Uncharacterized protein n=1 Tax=Nannocystis bainbridge TaxID=2995303 RepID=A0ABT5DV79_9BACT|nr:hypothetical protein [Nannocystis bainbridge]MDC0717536.1 hypothetical protein [Nannocystis bainbridge]